jgi:hypothetical protein
MDAQFPKLQIVWRNPQPVRRRHRWEHIEVGANSALYAVQEFLSTGEHGFWNTTCRLQIISDGAAQWRGTSACGSVELILVEK